MARLDSKARSRVYTMRDWPRGVRKRRWGFLHDQVWFPVPEDALPRPETTKIFNGEEYQLYLDRNMLWHPFGTIRIHTFHAGDDDAAFHSHPWWFVTFPLRSYTETVQTEDGRVSSRLVKAFRFHFRRATHRHFVHEPLRPFKTVLVTGRKKNEWGFYPKYDEFVHHREWTSYGV